jgi:hypothetical protein
LSEEFDKICQATFVADYRVTSKTEGESALSKNNKNVFVLQNDLGYIMKRTMSPPAVIRFAKFSQTNDPTNYFMTILKLYLPHRNPNQIKPHVFETYEDFYENGAVSLSVHTEVKPVKLIVEENRQTFEKAGSELQNAWELFQTAGPLEDAWSQVAPQTEQDRLDALAEIHDDNVDTGLQDDVISELQDTGQQQDNANAMSLSSVELMSESTRPLLRTMNDKQLEVFYYIRDWCLKSAQGTNPEAFFLHVNGGAGTGKSHLIKCVYYEATKLLRKENAPTDTTVLLTAPTGTAAFGIGGFTIHSALKIGKSNYDSLSNETLSTLQSKLGNLKILIIDEISMVNRKVFSCIHNRLKQLKHKKTTDRNAWFGDVCILAVGDFFQLSPVRADPLCFRNSEDGVDLWNDLFQIVTLEEIMRQKDDAPFANMMNRMRVKRKSDKFDDDDKMVLQGRNDLQNIPETALHVFATNALCSTYNTEMLLKHCENPRLLSAEDYVKDPYSSRMKKCAHPKKGKPDDLLDVLHIDIGARVMMTRNVDVADGLVNGAFGHAVAIDQVNLASPATAIFIRFDSDKAGKKQRQKQQGDADLPNNATAVKPYEEPLNSHKHSKRRQFPLKLAWACTIHKTQGMTANQCVFDMKGVFESGQSYVALSRVTSLQGLFLTNFKESLIYCNEKVETSLENMQKLESEQYQMTNTSTQALTVVYHNVQGLRSKLLDIEQNKHVQANVIMVSETWLTEMITDDAIKLGNYDVYRHDREDNNGRGGVLAYSDHHVVVKNLDIIVPGLENICLIIQKGKLIPCLCIGIYKSPSQPMQQFLDAFRELLETIDNMQHNSNVLIAGDFNENLLSDNPKPIKQLLQNYQYQQQVTQPTTRYGSLLDAVYVRSQLTVNTHVLPTYYSDHDALRINIDE